MSRANRTKQVATVNVFLFEASVVLNNVFGFDPILYQVSKAVLLVFMLTTLFQIIKTKVVRVGHSIVGPLLFMVLSFGSILWATYPEATEKQLITQFQLYLLFFVVYYQIRQENIRISHYFTALYISGIGMMAYAVFQYGLVGFYDAMLSGNRMGGIITNENVFGMVFAQAAIVSYFLFDKKKQPLYLGMIVVFLFFALSSGSKKAIIMIITGIAGIIVLKNGIRKAWKVAVGAIVLSIISSFVLQMTLFSTTSERLFSFMSGKLDVSDTIRANAINIGIDLFAKKPLLGYGVQNYIRLSGLNIYSHNNFVEIAVSLGIVGLLTYYSPYISYIFAIRRHGFIGSREKQLMYVLVFLSFILGYGMVQYMDKDAWIQMAIMCAMIDSWKGKNSYGEIEEVYP